MKFHQLTLAGAYVIEPEPFNDQRGRFARIFCGNELAEIGFNKQIVQVNHSVNFKKGALRGMHYQLPPKTEVKLVKCIRGRVFDVIVDVRSKSPTFLQWHGEGLSAENEKALLIPEGFAHGFQVLENNTEILYFHSEYYSPEHEAALHHNDPAIGIEWPLEVTEISAKDLEHPLIDSNFTGITL